MTRYSNPLTHNQAPPNQVPQSQGRPAGAGQPQPGYAYPPQPEPDHAAAWPSQGTPRTGGRPGGSSYPNSGYGDQQASAPHDPYAALRPDGYGYAQPAQPASDPYGLAGYTAPRAPQPQPSSYDAFGGASDPYGNTGSFGYGAQPAAPGPGSFGAAKTAAASPAPSFGSYAAQPGLQPQAASHTQASHYAGGYAPQGAPSDQWGVQGLGGGQGLGSAPGGLALDPRDYDGHGYGGSVGGNGNAALGQQGQWAGDVYGDPQMDPALAQQAYANGQQHASFDQSYADDEAQYEEEPRRSSWKKIATLVASTVVVGSGLVFAYGSIMGSGNSGPTPVVKGAEGPAKVKPSEPGGKQFAHADSKIMGRLGEAETPEADAGGVRKVPVVVVGRDGSIQPPPAAAPEDQTRAVVTVPGLTVIDGLGGGGPSPNRPAGPSAQQQQPQQQAASPPVQMVTASDSEKPIVVAPPKQPSAKKPTNLIASADNSGATAVQTKATVSPPKKERTVVAAADPVASGPKPTGAGYVAVLASVPASNSSRIDALKQFADMQQKYGTILQNKTPDVQEANLGEKGTYHRLLVGPPGSRDSASSVCTQLKAEGYAGCWVTAY